MKFGAYFSPHWPVGMSQKAVYHNLLDHIVWAEQLGFAGAWMTEHHFATDPSYPAFGEGPFPAYDVVADPLTLIGHAAALTSRIRLGTAVLVLPYDNPVRVAERAAMVDLLSNGRLELGLGRGSGLLEPAVFGVPEKSEDAYEKFFEALDVLRQALTGERFHHQGRFYSYPEFAVVPTPQQRPIPMYLSNMNPQSVAYAAQHGLSYAAVATARGGAGVDRHNLIHDEFVRLAAESGRSVEGLNFPQIVYCYVAPTDAEAIEVAEASLMKRDGFAEAHYQSQRSGKQDPMQTSWKEKFSVQFKAQLESNLIGSPATVAEKLAALKARVPSLNYILGGFGISTAPADFTRRSMQLLATEVMPKFAE